MNALVLMPKSRIAEVGWTGVDLVEHRPLAGAQRIERIGVEEIFQDLDDLLL